MTKEKREQARIEIREVVRIRSGDWEWKALSKNISCLGMFLISNNLPRIDSTIELWFSVEKTNIHTTAIVRWIGKDGFGVHFKSLDAQGCHAIGSIKI